MAKSKGSLKIGRKCPFCGHVWIGDAKSKRCPKCFKIIGAATPQEIATAKGQVPLRIAVQPALQAGSETGSKPASDESTAVQAVEVKQEEKQLQAAPETVIPGLYREDKKPPELEIRAEVLAGVWNSIFGIAAAIQNDSDWNLTERESKNLGELSVPVVKKYAPDLLKEHYELAILGVSVAATVLGKAQLTAAKRQKKEGGENDGRGKTETQPARVNRVSA